MSSTELKANLDVQPLERDRYAAALVMKNVPSFNTADLATEFVARVIAKERSIYESERVTDLQSDMSKMVNAQLSRRVREFMLKFHQHVQTSPTVPPVAQVRFRLALIAEEFFELLDACGIVPRDMRRGDESGCSVLDAIQDLEIEMDLPAFADALADLDYVIEGTRAAFGINGHPIADAVHAANMAKECTVTDNSAFKVWKPEGWTPPDVRALLIAQGWIPPRPEFPVINDMPPDAVITNE